LSSELCLKGLPQFYQKFDFSIFKEYSYYYVVEKNLKQAGVICGFVLVKTLSCLNIKSSQNDEIQ